MNSLILSSTIICVFSLFFLNKKSSHDGFFKGYDINGNAPSLSSLVLSQATTWIFARSLLNAAILGFYYGFWGTFAYACYYLSFISGWKIIDTIRFKYNCQSIQSFLYIKYGYIGSLLYNVLIILRLISEVFANLLVIGLLFGPPNGTNYILAVVLFSIFTLIYSSKGGLRASILTDRYQMMIFLIMLMILAFSFVFSPSIDYFNAIINSFYLSDTFLDSNATGSINPGFALVFVALIQFISYPMHDPVMMDRGLIADRKTTKQSFFYAFYLSVFCIMLFGSFGIVAQSLATDGQEMTAVIKSILGKHLFIIFNLCLIISAISTLDSTLSSAAKLFIIDFKNHNNKSLSKHTSLVRGKVVMTLFLLAGLALLFLNNKDIYAAVAVSGTASMFLLPVITFQIFGSVDSFSRYSYMICFVLSISAAVIYFIESSKGISILPSIYASDHKYTKLLVICIVLAFINHLIYFIDYKFRLDNRYKDKLKTT